MLTMLKTELQTVGLDNEGVKIAKGLVMVAKMELSATVSSLMPKGSPDFKGVVNYPMISDMVAANGEKTMVKALLLLVKDLCKSLNLVRNMDEGQMIEAAQFLLEECGNFRLEDYLMMFAMIKRGKLVKVLDRMDVQIIGQALDEYWKLRNQRGEEMLGDRQDFDFTKHPANTHVNDVAKTLLDMRREVDDQKRAQWEEQSEERKKSLERLKEFGLDLSAERVSFEKEAVSGFCDLLQSGKEMDDIDRQFYANNSEAIEAELLERKKAS